LSEVAEPLAAEAERTIFSSFAIIDKIYVYRNLVSKSEDMVSWRWHYDNHPDQIVKVMVYLTDVDEDSGPFEFLRSTATGSAAVIPPWPHAADTWVNPRRLQRWKDQGFAPFRCVGPRSTIVLFDNNVVHKANRAATRHRDVMVMQLRPATFLAERRMDRRWTGSFEHEDFNSDPNDYRALRKRSLHSG
jgi:hypothetical protein